MDGPSTIEEAYDTRRLVMRLASSARSNVLMKNLSFNVGTKTVQTHSYFSGKETYITAVSFITLALKELGYIGFSSSGITCVDACENDIAALSVLHGLRFKSGIPLTHLFGDVNQRLLPVRMKDVDAILDHVKDKPIEAKRAAAKTLLEYMLKHSKEGQLFYEVDYCYMHNQICPLSDTNLIPTPIETLAKIAATNALTPEVPHIDMDDFSTQGSSLREAVEAEESSQVWGYNSSNTIKPC